MKHTKASTCVKAHLGTWMRSSHQMKRRGFFSFLLLPCVWTQLLPHSHLTDAHNQPIRPSAGVYLFSITSPKKRALCEVTAIPGQIKGGGCWSLGPTPAVRCPATRTPANGRRGPKVSKVTSAVRRVVRPVAEVGARGIFQPWELEHEAVSQLVQMVQHLRTETKRRP